MRPTALASSEPDSVTAMPSGFAFVASPMARNIMYTTLSSAQTFFMKFVLPPVWITGFGMGAMGLWMGDLHANHGMAPPDFMKWQFLLAWVLGSTFILWSCARLKRVRLDGGRLFVSNYLRESSVPLAMIDEVTENRWLNIRPVTLRFRGATDFGDRICFMPKARWFPFWRPHPIVEELRQLARAARTQRAPAPRA